MAMETKMAFLREIETDLSTVVLAGEMNGVLSALADRLQLYEMSDAPGAVHDTDDMLQTFLDARTVQGYSPKTLYLYQRQITRLRNYLNIPTRSITVHHLRKYLAAEKSRGLSDNTLSNIRDVIHSYFGWLWRERLIDYDPSANLDTVKVPKREKPILSEAEIERLKLASTCLRDRAIICFLKSSACRIGEMVGLNRNDIDLAKLQCTVIGKGNKQRTVYISDVAAMLITEYLATRTDDNPALFVSKRNCRYSIGGVQTMLRKLGQQTGIGKVHPHLFRRTQLTELSGRGMAIEQVKAIAGHEKIDTTMDYVMMNQANLENAYRRYS